MENYKKYQEDLQASRAEFVFESYRKKYFSRGQLNVSVNKEHRNEPQYLHKLFRSDISVLNGERVIINKEEDLKVYVD